ncbi:hypothetical protein ES703_123971 [subsurface metagenome]
MVFISGITAKAAVGSDINLTADDGLYPHLFGSQVELNSAIHNPMVGYRQAVHPQLPRLRYQLGNSAHAIKQTILGMNMEMSEHSTFYTGL